MNISNVNSLGSIAALAALEWSFPPSVYVVAIIGATVLGTLCLKYKDPAKKKLNFVLAAAGGLVFVPIGLKYFEYRMNLSQPASLASSMNSAPQGIPIHILLPLFAATVVLSVLTRRCRR